jgi:DNA adenine methylase
MHYLGSKARHAAEIISITCANRRENQIYIEPFVGGGNVINKVPQGAGRIANDKNYGMVALLDALGNHDWTPPEKMTQSEWKKIMKGGIRESDDLLQKALFAFAATGPTFGSMWCGQWAKDYEGMEGTRYRQARDAALKDAPGLKGIKFFSDSFDKLEIPDGSLVYCDPPYAGTTGYSGAVRTIKADDKTSSNEWRADIFWRWADKLALEKGCSVFVSEYKGPSGGAFANFVQPPQHLKDELTAARAARKVLDSDDSATNEQFEAANLRIFEADNAVKSYAADYAAQWEVQWEKEVVSDFSASRSKENEDKRQASWRKYLRGTTEWESNQEDEVKWFKKMIPESHYEWPPGEEAPVVMDAGKKETEKLFHRSIR